MQLQRVKAIIIARCVTLDFLQNFKFFRFLDTDVLKYLVISKFLLNIQAVGLSNLLAFWITKSKERLNFWIIRIKFRIKVYLFSHLFVYFRIPLNLLISGNRKFPVVWSFAYKDDSRTRFEKNIRVQNRTLCKTAWKRERKKTKNQTRTRHKEPLRRWLTSRPVPFLSFRVRAKARALSPQDSASRSSSSPPSKQRIGRKRGYEGEASGKERLGSESGLIYLPELIVP